MQASLLDTDTLSEIMKGRDPAVLGRAREYLTQFNSFAFSIITRYEILRGLKAKKATAQIEAFEKRCQGSRVFSLTDDIVVRAADVYAYLRSRGELISDADILIAATAAEEGLVLVTNNTEHFERVPDLKIDCWANR